MTLFMFQISFCSVSLAPQGDWPRRGQPHDHPERGHRVRTNAAQAWNGNRQHRGPHGLPKPDSGAHTARVRKHLWEVEVSTQKSGPLNMDFFSFIPLVFGWTECCCGPSSWKKIMKFTFMDRTVYKTCCTYTSFGGKFKKIKKVYRFHPLFQLPFLLRVAVWMMNSVSQRRRADICVIWWIWVFRFFLHKHWILVASIVIWTWTRCQWHPSWPDFDRSLRQPVVSVALEAQAATSLLEDWAESELKTFFFFLVELCLSTCEPVCGFGSGGKNNNQCYVNWLSIGTWMNWILSPHLL